MAVSGYIESIWINGVEFPLQDKKIVSESLAPNTTNHTGPGWLRRWKEKREAQLETVFHAGYGELTVEKGSKAYEELLKVCRFKDE
jgi:hypothetical protein